MIYEVGLPNSGIVNIRDLDWTKIGPGDIVKIHAKDVPYNETVCIGTGGSIDKPLIIEGVPDKNGNLPIIDANNAIVSDKLKYWNVDRGLIHISGTEIPADSFVINLIIRNLKLVNAKFGTKLYNSSGQFLFNMAENAAAVHLEKGSDITFDNIHMDNCGCGFFIGSTNRLDLYPNSSNILIKNCVQTNMTLGGGNGQVHANYTSAINTIFENCKISTINDGGAAIKSRDFGLTIRYCLIDGGNYCIDAVNSTVAEYEMKKNPAQEQRATKIYGNVIIKRHLFGQQSILHFGKDTNDGLPQGKVFFNHNTVFTFHESGSTFFLINSPNTNVYSFKNYFLIPNQIGVVGKQDQGNPGYLPYYGITLMNGEGYLEIDSCILPRGALPDETFPPLCFIYRDKPIGGLGTLVKRNCKNINAILPTKFMDYILEYDLGERIGGYNRGTYAVTKFTGSLTPFNDSPLIDLPVIFPVGMDLPDKNWNGTARTSHKDIGVSSFETIQNPPPPPDPIPQPELITLLEDYGKANEQLSKAIKEAETIKSKIDAILKTYNLETR